MVALIETYSPDQLGLPTSLWTRETVGTLIKKRFGLALSVWTVGRYLRHWGFTPQKPACRASEQDPEAVRRWLEVAYPEVRKQAKAEGAKIHWGMKWGYARTIRQGAPGAGRGRPSGFGARGSAFGVTSSRP